MTISLAGWCSQLMAQQGSVSFLFIGDVMGHRPQIVAAYDSSTAGYNYKKVFEEVAPYFKHVDFAVANLEVTLAGPPYTGYPEFSSPDELATALRSSGIDAVVTANNHSCDYGGRGLVRTIQVLDSVGLHHTGTFVDSCDRVENNLLIFEKNGLRVGLLNYTYGTNFREVPYPNIVNRIDTALMKADIHLALKRRLDKLMVYLHWGEEYKQEPSGGQHDVADFLLENGVDIIIGAHPHVLQPFRYWSDCETGEGLVAYSLGNFVSDQRTSGRDGGAMLQVSLTKSGDESKISDVGYYLTWVKKTRKESRVSYSVLPIASYHASGADGLNVSQRRKMKKFLADNRKLLRKDNSIKEILKEPCYETTYVSVPDYFGYDGLGPFVRPVALPLTEFRHLHISKGGEWSH